MLISFISDVIDTSLITNDAFNLVAAGCGSGKTYWVINNLLKAYPDVRPCEVLFVTSRSITKNQQARNVGTTKLRRDDPKIIQFWNGREDDEEILDQYGIMLMTYDQIIEIINSGSGEQFEVMGKAKIIVLDECHVMFSDDFIEDIGLLRLWLREVVYGRRKLLIGLSATTQIINYHSDAWGVPINRLNKNVVTGYQAKRMICTDFDTIPYLISANKLPGKTIIMCHSIRQCETLAGRLSNAAVVVSPHSPSFTEEMGRIRDYIIQNESLPPTFFTADGEERALEVLVSTSTLREGFNLRKSSGVRNVITCLTDELHVTQFAGRCRYSIDNLVIADTQIRSDNLKPGSYLVVSREKFKQYMNNKECVSWFNTISHLVEHDAYGTKKFVLGTDDNKFVNYINSKWLVPKGLSPDQIQHYRIWKDEDKAAIIKMANDCRLFDMFKSEVTFLRVIRLLQSSLGYDIETGRTSVSEGQQTYKLIVAFDEEKITYVPAHERINE